MLLLLALDHFLLVVWVIEIVNRIYTSNEIWMVSVDIAILKEDEVFDHLVCWFEALIKQGHHFIINSLSENLEPLKFRHLDLHNDSSQLFKDKLNTLQAWRFQSFDLLL